MEWLGAVKGLNASTMSEVWTLASGFKKETAMRERRGSKQLWCGRRGGGGGVGEEVRINLELSPFSFDRIGRSTMLSKQWQRSRDATKEKRKVIMARLLRRVPAPSSQRGDTGFATAEEAQAASGNHWPTRPVWQCGGVCTSSCDNWQDAKVKSETETGLAARREMEDEHGDE